MFMKLLNIFRRDPVIGDAVALADFIDRHAAFIVQKGIYEYSRARSAHYSKVLFREPEFHAAVELSRWRAYPLGLAMIAELAEGQLRRTVEAGPIGEGGRSGHRAPLDRFRELVLSVFDRYSAPAALGADHWSDQRAELARRLNLLGLHPPKRAIDIPEQYAQSYFAMMPIHEKLRGRDFPTTRNYLRVTMCNIHDELVRRLDPAAVAQSLRSAAWPPASVGPGPRAGKSPYQGPERPRE